MHVCSNFNCLKTPLTKQYQCRPSRQGSLQHRLPTLSPAYAANSRSLWCLFTKVSSRAWPANIKNGVRAIIAVDDHSHCKPCGCIRWAPTARCWSQKPCKLVLHHNRCVLRRSVANTACPLPSLTKQRRDEGAAHCVQRRDCVHAEPRPLLHAALEHGKGHLRAHGHRAAEGS